MWKLGNSTINAIFQIMIVAFLIITLWDLFRPKEIVSFEMPKQKEVSNIRIEVIARNYYQDKKFEVIEIENETFLFVDNSYIKQLNK